MMMANEAGKKIKKIGLTAILAGIMTVSLAACGGNGGTNNTSTGTSAQPSITAAPTTNATTAAATEVSTTDSAREEKIELSEWAIEPKDLELPAGKTKFIVTNVGEFTHNVAFSLEGQGIIGKSPDFKKDQNPQTFEVDLKPGTYKMVCTIVGHEDAGMVGTLTVK